MRRKGREIDLRVAVTLVDRMIFFRPRSPAKRTISKSATRSMVEVLLQNSPIDCLSSLTGFGIWRGDTHTRIELGKIGGLNDY